MADDTKYIVAGIDTDNPRDHVLNFALMIAHGGFHHKKWLIKAALNYIDSKDLNDNNEDVPACP